MSAVQDMTTLARWLEGFAGISKEGFFGKPGWVDGDKAPGHTSQVEELGLAKSWYNFWTLRFFFYSPNLIWFAMTALMYTCFPYDIEAASKGWAWGWVAKRLAVNATLAFCYYGFFFWALYIRGFTQRKYKPGSYPTVANMAHNTWYWSLGVVQWSLSECAMTRLWATGRVPYISDAELFSSPRQLMLLAFWVFVIPQWRDFHFYFAHRFSHIRAVYKYVHSLHHRNTDPEPFSGLCMHPVEHLIYFSNALTPSLFIGLSPIVYMWNFMHLSLAPGAGHSGFEDHWQADQYHYAHHAKFECNYGSPSTGWIDQLCGTFREKLGSSDAYRGEYTGNYDATQKESDGKRAEDTREEKKKVWSAQGYLAVPQGSHLAYTLFCLFAVAALAWAAVVNPRRTSPVPAAPFVAALVAYGPVAFAMLLCAFYDKLSWRWPFHNERFFGVFGFFLVAGWASCLAPIHRFVYLLCEV